MTEKLRREAELRKKAAQPATYSESLKQNFRKKDEMKSLSKEEIRNRMCEELGRGC
jgi:hypothetical protein